MKQLFTFLALCLLVVSGCTKKNDQVWIPAWQETSAMTIARAGAAYVEYNDFIYAIAGVDGKAFLSSVESAKINKDGTLGPWKVVSALPQPRGFISAVVKNERLYVVGGGNGPYGKNLLNSVVSASFKPNGELGEWRTESSRMLLPRRCAKVFVLEDQLFAAGGFAGNLLDSVEFADFQPNTMLGEWQLMKEKLTRPRYVNELKKLDDLVVAIGGHDASSGKGIVDVEYLDSASREAKWQNTSSLNQGRYAFASAAVNDRLYAMGGLSGSEYLETIEYIDLSGMQAGGAWRFNTTLPEKMANLSALTVNDRIYLFGGSTRQGYLNQVWYANVNSEGNIGYWGTPEQKEKINVAVEAKNQISLPNRGLVVESVQSGDYAYMHVKGDKGEQWIAAPKNQIPPGAIVRYSEGVLMTNFHSKSLQRNFDSILFVGTIEKEE